MYDLNWMLQRPKSSSASKIVGVIWVSTVTCRVTPVNSAVVFVSHVCLPRHLIKTTNLTSSSCQDNLSDDKINVSVIEYRIYWMFVVLDKAFCET